MNKKLIMILGLVLSSMLMKAQAFFGSLEKVCGYRSTIKILFCPFIKLNNG